MRLNLRFLFAFVTLSFLVLTGCGERLRPFPPGEAPTATTEGLTATVVAMQREPHAVDLTLTIVNRRENAVVITTDQRSMIGIILSDSTISVQGHRLIQGRINSPSRLRIPSGSQVNLRLSFHDRDLHVDEPLHLRILATGKNVPLTLQLTIP